MIIFLNQDMLGPLLFVFYIVICNAILSPSCTVRCTGALFCCPLRYASYPSQDQIPEWKSYPEEVAAVPKWSLFSPDSSNTICSLFSPSPVCVVCVCVYCVRVGMHACMWCVCVCVCVYCVHVCMRACMWCVCVCC